MPQVETPSKPVQAEVKDAVNRKRSTPLLIILLAVAVIGAGLGVRYWRYASAHVSTDNASLTADVVQIAPQVTGTVKQVLVKDNQMVNAGDLLVVLDDATIKASVEQAQANLDAAIAQAKGAGVSVVLTEETGNAQQMQAKGAVDQAQSAIEGAQADISKVGAAVDNAVAIARGADANVNTARAAVTVAIAGKQKSVEAVSSAEAQVQTAEASVQAAEAGVEAAQATYEKSTHDARRYAALFAKGAISEQAQDQAQTAERAAAAQLESARQQVASARSVVNQRKADLNSARKQLDSADAAIEQSKAQLIAAREQAAAAKTGIRSARAQAQSATQAVAQAVARKQQALGQLSQAQTTPRQVDVSKSTQLQAQARIEQAKAALNAARVQLGYTRIYAPVSGRVSKKVVEVGSLVQPGTPLMAVVPSENVWVVANFKETQTARIGVGQPAEIDVDAMPGRTFHGKVDSISAATGSTFALLPADNATGNFVKVVQRIPVKIVIDPNQPNIDRLRAGMSVTAIVSTR